MVLESFLSFPFLWYSELGQCIWKLAVGLCVGLSSEAVPVAAVVETVQHCHQQCPVVVGQVLHEGPSVACL